MPDCKNCPEANDCLTKGVLDFETDAIDAYMDVIAHNWEALKELSEEALGTSLPIDGQRLMILNLELAMINRLEEAENNYMKALRLLRDIAEYISEYKPVTIDSAHLILELKTLIKEGFDA